ncbi:MAG: hypothetical protein ACLQJR_20310 [Stellaceae bacterium]
MMPSPGRPDEARERTNLTAAHPSTIALPAKQRESSFDKRWINSVASFDMALRAANPFDRSAIEPSGADREAFGRVGQDEAFFFVPSTM